MKPYTKTYRRACSNIALDNINHAMTGLAALTAEPINPGDLHPISFGNYLTSTEYTTEIRLHIANNIANIGTMADWIIEVTK